MRPLAGVRVLDLSRVVAGPYCTMQLGDLGAEIIKIERPDLGDDSRAFGPPYQGGEAAYYLSVNRNKKSVTLDLKSEQGAAVLWRLIDVSDVLVESFRPGVMNRLGFSAKAVLERNPRIIYGSISGFGSTGPAANRPGYDLIVQGEAGLMDITGQVDGPPSKVGTSIADLASGLHAAQGILAALFERERSGKGQHLEVSMVDATASLLTFNAGIYFATGEAPKRRGNEHPTIVPYETFGAADGWINIAVGNDNLWQALCAALERVDLAEDPRFKTAPLRVENRRELSPKLNDILSTRPRDHWIDLFNAHGIPCGAIRSVAEVCDGPILNDRERIVSMPHPQAGQVKAIKSPLEFSRSSIDGYEAPPLLGEHTEAVLRELAGLSDAELDEMKRSGAI